MTISTEEHRKTSIEDETTGKKYRVRDRNPGPGGDGTVKVWGENLTFDEAHRLKERVTGMEWSKSARIEEMTVPLAAPPAPSTAELEQDPIIAQAKRMAMGAGAGAASAANERAKIVKLEQQLKDMQAQLARMPKPPMVDMTAGDLPDSDDVVTMVGEEDEEVPAALAVDTETDAQIEANGKKLYEAFAATRKGPQKGWADLPEQEKDTFRWEATYEQGPHYEAVHKTASTAS